MAFVDEVTVVVRGGRGGDGAASFRREPYTPRGGPDGGNGGRGGDVVLEVSTRVRDLAWFLEHRRLAADDGGSGRSNRRDGAAGRDLVVAVPDGTVVLDEEGLLADLVGKGARAVVARGGRGGRGNAALASPRNRLPRRAEAGEPGEERRLTLELRVVADVGLVGPPNAGKSTLLASLTAARPRIAAHPFTTLAPNLGVAEGEGHRFVLADVPGLVEGAHRGRGLGHRFLRHVSRCRALVYVVDLSGPDPAADLAMVREELRAYDPDLPARPHLVAATKADLVEDPGRAAGALGPDAVVVSAVTGRGLEELARRMEALAREAAEREGERRPYVVLRPARPRFVVRREGERFRVVGRGVERWVAETDLEDPRQVARLQRRLAREGVERELEAKGARRGDEVVIGEQVFEFIPDRDLEEGDGGPA
ncbi:MAG TPA: GTPase ObgE [Actinomycetota bacterium]|nr:GTPase ObgE [Actinomycetota bacterium]